MERSIKFRDFKSQDVDFIYKCKNDEKLNRYVVGDWHPFSRAESEKWLQGCMADSPNYKFWAICTNDSDEKIIGWISLSKINLQEKTAHFHGIVIGDPNYQDGIAWIESYQLLFERVFLGMKFLRLSGSHLSIHPASGIIAECMFMGVDKVEPNSIEKNGKLIDHIIVSIDSKTYLEHYQKGDYEFSKIQKRILQKYKSKKHK